jgi:hypothetical protein
VVPDLSSAAERVSEIVSTAMLSGMNCFDTSMADMAFDFPLVSDAMQRPSRRAAEPQPNYGIEPDGGPGSAAHRFTLRRIEVTIPYRYNAPALNVSQAFIVPC